MIDKFKPLLAVQADLDNLDYTDLLLSPKLDGIRAIVIDGVVLSRSLKPIPNLYIQSLFKHLEFYDGELIVGSPTAPDVYRTSNSGCMSVNGVPDVTFYVFDHIQSPQLDYENRIMKLEDADNVCVLTQHQITDSYDLDVLEGLYLEQGYEGVMLRKSRGPNSKYKFGRATAKSHTLLKVKRFVDSEYRVVGFEERMHNANEATVNALGHTERSSHKENKSGRGDLGALILTTEDGLEFNCGTGFDNATRREIWDNRDQYMGKYAKVKSFLIGVKDKPRFPVFLGFRDASDMSA